LLLKKTVLQKAMVKQVIISNCKISKKHLSYHDRYTLIVKPGPTKQL